jgi:hypothetical protein
LPVPERPVKRNARVERFNAGEKCESKKGVVEVLWFSVAYDGTTKSLSSNVMLLGNMDSMQQKK